LKGGYDAWKAAGYPIETGAPQKGKSRLGLALKVNMNSKLEIDKVSHNNKGELH